MEKKKRRALIALCVIAALIVAAVVAVRLVLTRERLMAILIPKVEQAVGATVGVGDISVRFPFGFGVAARDLTFEKTLADSSSLDISAGTVTFRASLMSLIRRKPEIKAADVGKGSVTLFNPRRNSELALRGLDAHFSMASAAAEIGMSAKALVDSIRFGPRGAAPALALGAVTFDGDMAADPAFTKLAIKRSKVGWEGLVAATVTGEAADLKTRPRVSLEIVADEQPLAPLLERLRTLKASSAAAAPAPPLEVTKGTGSLRARVEGFPKELPELNVAFEITVKDLAFSAGETASVGALSAELKGAGSAAAWTGLLPSTAKPMTPEQIGAAWKRITLDGTVSVADASMTLKTAAAQTAAAQQAAPDGGTAGPAAEAVPQLRISSLKATAAVSGPDVKSVSAGFLLGGGPCTVDASLLNIIPASIELLSVARSLAASGAAAPDANLGPYLDRMVNAPTIRAEIKGRAFDVRPFEKPLSGTGEGGASAAPAAAAPHAASSNAPGAILLLKNTTFAARLDSLIAREAVLTAVDVKGTIRDGRIKVEPATFAYAGGAGRLTLAADARTPSRIETKIDFAVENVEAGAALSRLSPLGAFIQGRFTVKSNGQLATGKGINPLMAISIAGSALSSQGSLTLESFVAPLGSIQGFDITPFKKFDYKDWTGSFLVKDGRFHTQNWKMSSTRGAWDIKGSFGFDGSLDYAVHLVLPPDVQAQMKGLDRYKQAFDLMRDSSGNLLLDLHVGGNAKHPSASIDLTKARGKAQEKLLEDARKKMQQLLKR